MRTSSLGWVRGVWHGEGSSWGNEPRHDWWLVSRNLCMEVINHARYLWDIHESHLDFRAWPKSKPWGSYWWELLCIMSTEWITIETFPYLETSLLCVGTWQPQVAMALGEITEKKLLYKIGTAQIVSARTSQGHTNTQRDGRGDELTDEETKWRTKRRKEGGM